MSAPPPAKRGSSSLIGQTLSHYRVTAAIGAGGMGEVYRASDTQLGRDVALKLLPDGFASEPERLARFEREAKLLASLNHSNIAHVYGFESTTLADGTKAHVLVMEFVEGDDLAARSAARSRSTRRSRSQGRSRRRSKKRTREASSTATSSPPISRSRRTAR